MSSEETSQEVPAAPHPSFPELLMMNLSDPNPSPGTYYPVPVPEGLLQQRHTDEKTLRLGQWERLASPQRKRAFLRQLPWRLLHQNLFLW